MTSPLCARCGATMPERGHYIDRLLWVAGAPAVAWCGPCADADILADRAQIVRLGVDRWLALIEERGPGRVVREVAA